MTADLASLQHMADSLCAPPVHMPKQQVAGVLRGLVDHNVDYAEVTGAVTIYGEKVDLKDLAAVANTVSP